MLSFTYSKEFIWEFMSERKYANIFMVWNRDKTKYHIDEISNISV